MRRSTILCTPLLLILLGASALCQTPQSYLNDTGSPAYGVTIPVENGFIDVSNGNLHMEFPLASHPQRGALGLNESIVYDSRIWMFSPFGSNGSYHWWPYNACGGSTICSSAGSNSGGWRFITGAEIGTISYSLTQSNVNYTNCYPYGGSIYDQEQVGTLTSQLIWTDPTGTVHPFNAQSIQYINDCNGSQTQSFSGGTAADGSGYSASDDGSGNPIIKSNDGTEVYPQIIDRFGNYWSTDANGNLIDDTGRIPVIVTQSGNVTYYDVLAPNGSKYTHNGQLDTNNRLRYTVTTATISVTTNFGQSYTYEFVASSLLAPVQSIQLPDGSTYTFAYDSYGEMSSVTLPTAGTITYSYSNFSDSSYTSNRWLASRTVGSNPAMTFTPSVITNCQNYSTGCVEQVNLHKPSGDETAYQLTLINGAWNTGQTTYTGSAASGVKLAQVINSNTYSNGCTSSLNCVGANYLSNALTTNVLFAGTLGAAQPVYSQTSASYNLAVGKISDIKQWDYASWSSGISTSTPPNSTPIRETQYTYTGVDPYQIKVFDASGSQAGLTTYAYTHTAAATSGIPQHATQNAGGPYLQSVFHWLNTGGGSPTTTYSFDDTGMVASITDANGNPPSSTSYQCANSLPSQALNALGQPTQFTYDCASGAILNVKNPNDLAPPTYPGTTYAYEATGGRIWTVSSSDSGLTTYSYPSAQEVDTAVTASPDPTIVSVAKVDVYGRPSASIVGGVEIDTFYDVNGRANCQTNPYTTSSSGRTCITSYDGLDRPLTQLQADGTPVVWAYGGNIFVSSNASGATWVRSVDALGRLTNVAEPNPASTNSFSTAYTYDGLGNVRSIAQSGNLSTDTPRTHTFTYDSMSRLICTQHPESSASGVSCPTSAAGTMPSGVLTRQYDLNGNVTSITDARSQTVSYAYEALNRPTWKKQNGSYAAQYYYDGNYGQYAVSSLSGSSPNLIGRLSFVRASQPTGPTPPVSISGFTTQYFDDQYFGYDAMGRLKYWTDAPPSEWGTTSHSASAAYDLAGNMMSLSYPGTGGLTVNQTFDGAGRLSTVTSPARPFVSGISYLPSGAPQTITYGNGVTETWSQNNRLQPCEHTVALPGSIGGTTVMDQQYFYSSTTGAPCSGASTTNIGNIMQIVNNTNPAHGSNNYNQTLSYDTLNRLHTWSTPSMGGQARSQTFSYDAFGNMLNAASAYPPPGNVPDPLSFTASYASNNRMLPASSSCLPMPPATPTGTPGQVNVYDNAGNQLCNGTQGSAQAFVWDAESRLTSLWSQQNNNTYAEQALYGYDANGQRLRVDQMVPGSGGPQTQTFKEYAWFGGRLLAEKDQTGNWTDYVYAGGQKIAMIQASDQRYHLTGTYLATADGNRWTVGPVSFPAGLTVQAGDVLNYRIYQHNASAGISMGFTDKSNSDWYCSNCKYSVSQSDAWVPVSVALGGSVSSPGPMVGKALSYFQTGNFQGGPNGEFDVMLADPSITRADGSVVQFPIAQGATWWGGDTPNESGTSYAGETVSANSGLVGAIGNTRFFIGDQLGTAQMEFASGGWPMSFGQFAPYGQELDAQATANRYKYTGLELDSESQLDHATFRQYSPVSTRWMTADPFDGSIDASNPQSLNRYSYVNNMPFNFTDPSGLGPEGSGGGGGVGCIAAISEGGVDPIADITCGLQLYMFYKDIQRLFYHPKFTASHVPRPGAHVWDEHGSYTAKPNNGIGDLLGLSGAGCEFGACEGGPSDFTQGSPRSHGTCTPWLGVGCQTQTFPALINMKAVSRFVCKGSYEKRVEASVISGARNGALIGLYRGATAGAEVGAVGEGVGAVPGALIGGAVGAGAGAYNGSRTGVVFAEACSFLGAYSH